MAKGFQFRKGRMKVTVSKVLKMPPGEGGGGSQQQPPDPLTCSHLVELSVLAPSGSDAVAEDMRNFAEQLKPLVALEKIDPKRAPI